MSGLHPCLIEIVPYAQRACLNIVIKIREMKKDAQWVTRVPSRSGNPGRRSVNSSRLGRARRTTKAHGFIFTRPHSHRWTPPPSWPNSQRLRLPFCCTDLAQKAWRGPACVTCSGHRHGLRHPWRRKAGEGRKVGSQAAGSALPLATSPPFLESAGLFSSRVGNCRQYIDGGPASYEILQFYGAPVSKQQVWISGRSPGYARANARVGSPLEMSGFSHAITGNPVRIGRSVASQSSLPPVPGGCYSTEEDHLSFILLLRADREIQERQHRLLH